MFGKGEKSSKKGLFKSLKTFRHPKLEKGPEKSYRIIGIHCDPQSIV